MRASISLKANGATAHICAACRRAAQTSTRTSSRSLSRIAAPAVSARNQILAQNRSQRWFSHTQTRRSEQTASSDLPHSVSGQPRPSPPSYYALFPQSLPQGPPPSGPFAIDVRSLRREFLRLQAASHPDFHAHANADPSARRKAEGTSALINEAFRTLCNPLLRAQYLLREQFGLDLAGDEAGSIATAEGDVLEAVLDAREQIEEADSEDELVELREENEERIAAAEDVLGQAFKSGDLESLKREVVRLRYWVNIREGIDNWEKGKPIVLEH